MTVTWVVDSRIRASAGHGADFFFGSDSAPATLVAVVRGFDWLNDSPDTVEVRIRPAGEVLSEDDLVSAKRVIEDYLRGASISGGCDHIGHDIHVFING